MPSMAPVTREGFVDLLSAQDAPPDTMEIARKLEVKHDVIVGHVKALMGMEAISTEPVNCRRWIGIFYVTVYLTSG